MAKRRYKKNGTPSLLTVILRILIIAILLAAIVITVNRVAEVINNDRKMSLLENTQEHRAEDFLVARCFFMGAV